MQVTVTVFGKTFNIPAIIQFIIALLTMIAPFFAGVQYGKQTAGKKPPVKRQQLKAPAVVKQYPTGRVVTRRSVELLRQKVLEQQGKNFNHGKATQSYYNCVEKGFVPPIEDQGNCGSCWDFSGTGMCDCAFIVAGIFPKDGSMAFSEQYVMDCGTNGGCNGDDNVTVLDMSEKTGLVTSKDYGPYLQHEAKCNDNGTMKKYKITNWGLCDGQGLADTQKIKNFMLTYGPIGSAIAADNAFMNIQPGTVFAGSGATEINHDIILVGWDDSKGAWLLRNSWGQGWADNGYCWIKYGANQVGTEAVWCTVGPEPIPPLTGGNHALWIFGAVIVVLFLGYVAFRYFGQRYPQD